VGFAFGMFVTSREGQIIGLFAATLFYLAAVLFH
jgi:hypothetical protein